MSTAAAPGWYPQSDGTLRFWDGSAWTDQTARVDPARGAEPPPAAPASGLPLQQVAHDLSIAYLTNRYGAEVVGEFSVSATQDWSGSSPRVTDVSGSGEVATHHLPDVMKPGMRGVEVKTGGRYLFGLGAEKTSTVDVPTGEYEVDPVFRSMIRDYHQAYARFLHLLTHP